MISTIKKQRPLIIRGSFSCLSENTSKEMKGMSVKEKADNEKLKVIEELLNNLRFGELQITVHEGKIVQINRIEKKRFPA